uniref:Uncharacterized protein n=1 Tax=Panagrolaimus superbus TaxID=310955 RepID=A0A914XSE5_9BILA
MFDVDGTPLDTHVTVYHSGQYDTLPTTSNIETTPLKAVEKDDFAAKLGSKITGFFKKGAAHQDYPTTEIYEGPIATTSRITDVDGSPLDTHVQVYHSGRSDLPSTTAIIETQPIEAEDVEKAPTLSSRITGFFKKGAAHQDYPSTEVYEGPITSTTKINDINGLPLETHVSVYHPGRSDLPVTTITHAEAQQKP